MKIFLKYFIVCMFGVSIAMEMPPSAGTKREAPEDIEERPQKFRKVEAAQEPQPMDIEPIAHAPAIIPAIPPRITDPSIAPVGSTPIYNEKLANEIIQHIMLKLISNVPGSSLDAKLQKAADNVRNFLITSKHFAVWFKDPHFNGLLIKDLARRYTRNNDLVSAAIALRTIGSQLWLSELITKNEDWRAKLTPSFLNAVHSGNISIANFLAELVQDVFASNQEGHSTLMVAAENGDFTMFELLKEYGEDFVGDVKEELASTDKFGLNLLHFAAKGENPKLIKRILELNIPIESRNNVGETPLHLAAYDGNLEAVRTLLDNNAFILAPSNNYETPLMKTIPTPYDEFNYDEKQKHLQIIDLLIDKSPLVLKISDRDLITPLMKAVQSADPIFVKKLIDKGASIIINKQDKDDKTAFDYAYNLQDPAHSKDSEEFLSRKHQIIEILKKYGALSGKEIPKAPIEELSSESEQSEESESDMD